MKKQLMIIISALALLALTAQAQTSKSFKVEKGGRLEVSVRSGDITVRPTNKSEVSVKAEGIDEEDLDKLKMEQNGNTVRVEFRPHGRNWGNWGGNDVHFDIDVPTDFNVDMSTSGGDLEVTGVLNGKIEGKTSGGNITLADIIGTVDMSTSGGNVRVGNIKGDVELGTSGGDIDLKRVDGEARVKTSGGDITVESVSKKLDARTSGGDIEIGDVGGSADVSTSGGDVKVGKVSGGAKLRTSGGNIYLTGASGDVDASTAGGDLDLEGVSGTIRGRTAGGDIKAELRPSGKGGSELKTAGGNIRLYVPESAKATIDAYIRIEGRWGSRRSKYQVRSDFKETTYDDHEDEIHAVYKLNGGGETIYLETVNSNIEIRKLTH
jgi:DUF4097 and DUF4098 domain-containing protein YvlB